MGQGGMGQGGVGQGGVGNPEGPGSRLRETGARTEHQRALRLVLVRPLAGVQ